MSSHYKAPWSRKLIITTGFFAVLLIVALIIMDSIAANILLLAILIVSLLMLVRGYSISEGKLLIHRLGWSSTYKLENLESVKFEPNITIGSIRAFGVGGFFGYVGKFRSKDLGSYEAYVTDEDNSVLLEFQDKKIVVSPDEPEKFTEEMKNYVKKV
jgi:hypothetical protein